MLIGWKQGRYTLTGEVQSENERGYTVRVTAYDKRAAAKHLGRKFFVFKQVAVILK